MPSKHLIPQLSPHLERTVIMVRISLKGAAKKSESINASNISKHEVEI